MNAEPVKLERPPVLYKRTGELVPFDDPRYEIAVDLQARLDEVEGLERDIRGWRTRYAELGRDLDKEAEADPLWPVAVACFFYWQRECNHPRAEWARERFDLVRPYLKKKKYGAEMVLRAIAGAGYDAFTTTRRNGSKKRHDGWELIFSNPGKFEDFVNRAPRDWTVPDDVLPS